MSKKIELIHAEVIPQYNSTEAIKEVKLESGAIIFSWQVKTKVNDKIDKSPMIYDNCSCFADNEEKKSVIRDLIKVGSIINIEGYQERSKGNKPDANGKTVYYDRISVKKLLPITGIEQVDPGTSQENDDDLPF